MLKRSRIDPKRVGRKKAKKAQKWDECIEIEVGPRFRLGRGGERSHRPTHNKPGQFFCASCALSPLIVLERLNSREIEIRSIRCRGSL